MAVYRLVSHPQICICSEEGYNSIIDWLILYWHGYRTEDLYSQEVKPKSNATGQGPITMPIQK